MRPSLPPSEPSPIQAKPQQSAERSATPYSASGPTAHPDTTPLAKGREAAAGVVQGRANTCFGDQGRYLLIEQIGVGGMGVVYKARQRDLDRLVALKMIHPGIGLAEGLLLRFEREARAAARLEHANIISIYDIGKWE